jgi:hypothetical protein
MAALALIDTRGQYHPFLAAMGVTVISDDQSLRPALALARPRSQSRKRLPPLGGPLIRRWTTLSTQFRKSLLAINCGRTSHHHIVSCTNEGATEWTMFCRSFATPTAAPLGALGQTLKSKTISIVQER